MVPRSIRSGRGQRPLPSTRTKATLLAQKEKRVSHLWRRRQSTKTPSQSTISRSRPTRRGPWLQLKDGEVSAEKIMQELATVITDDEASA